MYILRYYLTYAIAVILLANSLNVAIASMANAQSGTKVLICSSIGSRYITLDLPNSNTPNPIPKRHCVLCLIDMGHDKALTIPTENHSKEIYSSEKLLRKQYPVLTSYFNVYISRAPPSSLA